MDENNRSISIDEEIKVLKLKVKTGTMLYDGRIILIYESIQQKDDEPKQKKLKSNAVGVVKKILVKEGDVVTPGSVIVELEKKCNHPTVIKDLCAECGADLQKENADGQVSQASVSMVHMVPELKVNEELAQILGKADMDRLLEHKKLVLLVDLDQTIIHTTNDNIPNNIKDVYHFQLYYGGRSHWYHTRLRPGTHKFLQGISEKYELHICTFGSRRYAHKIAAFLDPDGRFFSHRILSRDECFDPNSKTANLRALFPCGDNMVCIIDDREDVWDYASNLIHVKLYHFFQHTGDIHAPPGLTKCENDDDKKGFDFSQINETQNNEDSKSNDQSENNDTEVDVDDEMKIDEVKETIEEIIREEIKENDAEKNPIAEPSEKEEDAKINSTVEENSLMDFSMEVPAEKCSPSDTETNQESIEPENNVKPSENGDKVEPDPATKSGKNSEKEIKPLETKESPEPQPDQSEEIIHTDNLPNNIPDENGWITIEETDDYLLYLEEILKTIHAEFFKRYEDSKIIPDLKIVVPETRAKVLEGVSIVFSGIVPSHIKLEKSQAYKIARSLGAKVTQNIESDTTHLVALRAGTAKVHAAYKRRNLKLVTPEWLWTCAERWEKVDERMFPLRNAKPNTKSRDPPAHCRSPEHPEPLPMPYQINKVNNSQVGGFMYSINPLMSLSSEDIETMEGEVEDMFKESDGEAEGVDDAFRLNEEDEKDSEIAMNRKRKLDESSSSTTEDEERFEKFAQVKKHKSKKMKINDDFSFKKLFHKNIQNEEENDDDDDDDEKDDDTDDDETISSKFRRGEALPSDLDMDYNSEDGTEDQESDGEWNVMGAALEREFLEGD